MLDRLANGQPEKSMILTGQRGIGKTVLLERFAETAAESGWFHDYYEVTSHAQLAAALARMTRRILLGMSLKERLKERATAALKVLKAFAAGGVTLNIDVEAALGKAAAFGLSAMRIRSRTSRSTSHTPSCSNTSTRASSTFV